MSETTQTSAATTARAAPAEIPTRLGAAIGAGIGGAVIGAALWAIVTVTTHYQIGFMAVGVGLLVGWGVQRTGRSGAPVLGVIGALLALIGCVLGNLMSAAGFAAQSGDATFGGVLATVLTSPDVAVAVLSATFHPMDLLFYAIAVYEGYKFARKPVAS